MTPLRTWGVDHAGRPMRHEPCGACYCKVPGDGYDRCPSRPLRTWADRMSYAAMLQAALAFVAVLDTVDMLRDVLRRGRR